MMADRELSGSVALVTGAARNIGRAIALELARAGAQVVVNARDSRDACEEVAAEIRAAGGEALVALADISDEASVASMMDKVKDRFGRLDIVVNNAAIRRENDIADLTYGEWREVLSVILDGAYLCARGALPMLLQSKAGAIINIGGMSAHTGARKRVHVVTAKAGLVGLTRGLAYDLADKGVTVNCVVPGMIDTARGGSSPEAPDHHKAHAPLVGRRGLPSEVARLVRYLAGPDARYLTGQTIHANGGVFMP
jgi:3-oxoacyl-[acyl-carrier protein] reductase